MRTDLFDYKLPPELIAQEPRSRGQARLLVLRRSDGSSQHCHFSDLLNFLNENDTIVFNDTRVIARRLTGILTSGATAEVFLLRAVGESQWAALVRPGRALRIGKEITLFARAPDTANVTARVVGIAPDGTRLLEFHTRQARDSAGSWGESPLPPYIHTPLPVEQEERYQTVYARTDGSAAAPTAGLHFTPELLTQIKSRGIALAFVTLHVGIDTFRPVKVEDTSQHEMHGEWFSVSQEAADIINQTTGRIIAVGTTSVRALEAAAQFSETEKRAGRVSAFTGDTHLFITPGYKFKAVDAMVTNFHLPQSTLLMLISAFAGRDLIFDAYSEAIALGYQFYSFGDAMLII